jgi:hypothetical protein
MIAPLYGIENKARESGLSPETRKDLRNQHAPAMLDRLHRRLLELNPTRVGGAGALFRRRSVRDRHEPGGERDPTELRG